MKVRRHHLVAVIVCAVVAVLLIHMAGIVQRDIQYRGVLKTYSDVLKPGMKRNEVENHFIMSKYVPFSRGASEDVVEIAREKPGWVCQEQVVYLKFEFNGIEPNEPKPGDSLVRTSLNRSVCLDVP